MYSEIPPVFCMWTKKNRSGCAAVAQAASGEYSAGEAEAPKNQLSIAQRLFRISGSAAVECRKSSSKSSTSPGSKIGRRTPVVAGRLLGDLLGDRPLEDGALGAGRDDVVETARDDVHAGGLVAAAREREPDVEGADVAHEGAVLVPAAPGVGVHPAQRALLDRDHRRLVEVAADRVASGPARSKVSSISKSSVGRVGGPEAAAPRDPIARRATRGRPGRARTPRSSRGSAAAAVDRRVARLEGAVDLVGERQRRSAIDQAADQQAAVAQDPGADQLGGELGRARCPPGRRCGPGAGRRPAPGSAASAGGVHQPDAGGVAKLDQADLASRRRGSRGSARVSSSISASSSSVLRPAATSGSRLRERSVGSSCVERSRLRKARSVVGRAGAPTTVAPAARRR